jgi:hypothetical protein
MCFVKLKLHSTHWSEYVYYTNLSMIQLFFGKKKLTLLLDLSISFDGYRDEIADNTRVL